MEYAELNTNSYFSFLHASTSPQHLVETAARLGLYALALTDHDSLAGAVQFMQAAKLSRIHGIIGSQVTLEDGGCLTLLAENQIGYANLCRLVTASRMDHLPANAPNAKEEAPWQGKIAPSLRWERLAGHTEGLIALTGGMDGPVAVPLLAGDKEAAQSTLTRLYDLFGPRHLFVELQQLDRPQDNRLLRQLSDLAYKWVLPVVATQDVHYATADYARLRDAMIAIDHNITLEQARRQGLLPYNHTACLRSADEMARLFRERPDALENTVKIADRCHAVIDFSARRLPHFQTPNGESEFKYLFDLCYIHLPFRYPDLRPEVVKQLAHELDVIEHAGLAGYFLIVWDMCRFAQEHGIRYQGRGAAANSLIAYLLKITNIDPLKYGLLFERFLSADRYTMPDIDLDFERERREEVIQYTYQKYGRDHTAMVATFITYQARSALRDLAKALGFETKVIDKLAKKLDTFSANAASTDLLAHLQEDNNDRAQQPLALLAHLMQQIDGVPRHLSIHSGGMLITDLPLNEVVPQEPATMEGRIVVQWDKDDVESAGLIKIDQLSLAMLSVISDCLAMIRVGGDVPDLAKLALDAPAVYQTLQRGDTVGTFQVESRAQQQMLPRLKPMRFEDIVVAIAIIRPGPIQGGMVHPYIRRRHGQEEVTYWHPKLEDVLQETLGVMLFQEQVLKTAMVLGGFSAGKADLLRRALSRSKPGPEMEMLRANFISGAEEKGIDAQTADTVFTQLAGYAGYGFCKSHSASFALIAYQSVWLKYYYPAEFYCALLNNQPVGFYSPEVILNDAARHGITELRATIQQSAWSYTVEHNEYGKALLRAGLSAVKGMGKAAYERLDKARQEASFANLRDFLWRAQLPKPLIENLIRAGALDEMGERPDLLWELGTLEVPHTGFDLPTQVVEVALPSLDGLTQTIWEYELMGHSPDGQLMRHYRAELRKAGILTGWQVKHEAKAGQRVWTAGMVVVRQRPGTAKGILFLSLEDESGLLDLVVKPNVYPSVRPILQETMLILACGVVQKGDGGVTSLLVGQMKRLV